MRLKLKLVGYYFLITIITGGFLYSQTKNLALTPSVFFIKPNAGSTFRLKNPCYPFKRKHNSVVRIAAELQELTGAVGSSPVLKMKFSEDVHVLIALPASQTLEPHGSFLYLDSALSITGLPSYKVYSVSYKKGWQDVDCFSPEGFVAGVVKANTTLKFRNAQMPDGRLWHTYVTDGFTDGKQLFEIISWSDTPVIDEGMAGTEEIQGGFEGGTCVKVGGKYHLFPTERAGEIGKPAVYDRVKTRIGHWESEDAIHWRRVGTIFQASGKYAISEYDNPMNDRRAAIWSYNAVFNEKEDRWYGYYLTYTVDKNIQPNHSFGRIWCTKSQTKGVDGIGGPYDEGQLIMEPGLDSQPWEGRQGVASFYPYPVKDGWLAFYAGAFPFNSWNDYPKNSTLGWYIGLARAESMDGPWTRLDTTINPVKTINPNFVENPLVYKMPQGGYLAMIDGGPDSGSYHFSNMIGCTYSKDGLHWSEARYIPLHTKLNVWWHTMRTPLCLISEGDNIYTILFAAINNNRFHPIGMLKVRLNVEAYMQLLNQ